MKTQIILAIVIIILFALENLFVYQTGKNSVKNQTINNTDTLTAFINIRDTVKIPVFRTRTHLDSIIIQDTVYISTVTDYIATIDTMYENDLAKLRVEFVSDIPLSRKSYFNLDLNVKKELVFIPVKDESIWHNRFIPYFGVGLSYSIDSKLIEPAIQLGFGIRLN